MKREALVCPFCGAPYRKVIPSEIVQVQCKYCGSTIVVPSSVPRCPNHPEVLAMSLCNDCSRSYCSDCLSVYFLHGEQESGVLNLCLDCLKKRYLNKAEHVILLGTLFLIFGFLGLLVEPFFGILWIVLFAVPVVIYGFYKLRLYGSQVVVNKGFKAGLEGESQRSSHEIYQDMIIEYAKSFGMARGSIMLENRIKSLMKAGLSREEAIRELAEDEGYT